MISPHWLVWTSRSSWSSSTVATTQTRSTFVRVEPNLTPQTYIGDILVAVNPFRPLEIYTPKVSIHWPAHSHTQFQATYRGRSKHDAAPHIFATADAAFHGLRNAKKDQCCVVRCDFAAALFSAISFFLSGSCVQTCVIWVRGISLRFEFGRMVDVLQW